MPPVLVRNRDFLSCPVLHKAACTVVSKPKMRTADGEFLRSKTGVSRAPGALRPAVPAAVLIKQNESASQVHVQIGTFRWHFRKAIAQATQKSTSKSHGHLLRCYIRSRWLKGPNSEKSSRLARQRNKPPSTAPAWPHARAPLLCAFFLILLYPYIRQVPGEGGTRAADTISG